MKKGKSIGSRLEEYRLSLGLTWRQVAERLELSVPMLMQVRSGLRKMGPLALRRFEDAEESGLIEIQSRKVIAGLLDDQGPARQLIQRISTGRGPFAVPLRYRSGPESLAKLNSVVMNAPSETSRERLLTLLRRTLDPKIVILACIDDDRFDEGSLARVTPACLQDLQQAAMTLLLGSRWRSILAKIALEEAGE